MVAKEKVSVKKINQQAYALANFLAKSAAVYAFRNGPVENIHAEGRLSQEDMKVLNKFMVDRLGEIFYLSAMHRGDDLIDMLNFSWKCTSGWDDINLSELENIVQRCKKSC